MPGVLTGKEGSTEVAFSEPITIQDPSWMQSEFCQQPILQMGKQRFREIETVYLISGTGSGSLIDIFQDECMNKWMNEWIPEWLSVNCVTVEHMTNSVSGEGVCHVEWASLLVSLNQNSTSLNSPLPILVSHPPWALVGCQVIWCCWGVNGGSGSLGPLPDDGFAFSICLCFKHCCGNRCRLDN